MYLQIELSYWKPSSPWRYLHSDLPLPCATCVLYSLSNCRSIPLIIMHCWTTSIERLMSKILCPLIKYRTKSRRSRRKFIKDLHSANWFFPHGYSSTRNLFHTRVSLEAAKNQIPVPEKTITAAFAYKLFTTLHLMVCKFQILPPNIDLPWDFFHLVVSPMWIPDYKSFLLILCCAFLAAKLALASCALLQAQQRQASIIDCLVG